METEFNETLHIKLFISMSFFLTNLYVCKIYWFYSPESSPENLVTKSASVHRQRNI